MTNEPERPTGEGRLRLNRHRLWIVIRSFVVASLAAWLILRVVPPGAADIVTICVVWIVFYPVARLNPKAPWWLHWVRGLFIVVGFLVALRLFR